MKIPFDNAVLTGLVAAGVFSSRRFDDVNTDELTDAFEGHVGIVRYIARLCVDADDYVERHCASLGVTWDQLDLYETVDALADAILTMFAAVNAGNPPETPGQLARRAIDNHVQKHVASDDSNMLLTLALTRETALASWRQEVELGRTLLGYNAWLQARTNQLDEAG